MPLIPDATAAAQSSKLSKPRGWVLVGDFAFCPDRVEGFLRIPERQQGALLMEAMTQVFFSGYTATVSDADGELFKFLADYRELK